MLLEAHKVSKAFGSFFAVREADLSVDEGEIVGLIGPNGAGKSTFSTAWQATPCRPKAKSFSPVTT
jgi:ABC-type branched-subunit amino acid transport system ATPase component